MNLNRDSTVRKIIKTIFAIAMGLSVIPTATGVTKVTAKLDSVSITMGAKTSMVLEIVQRQGERGEFPLIKPESGRGYVGLCNDSVELSGPLAYDTVDLGSGMVQINCRLNVQSFDSGYYKLPELAYVVGGDTTWSNATFLKVNPVAATAEDPIAGYAAEAEADGSRWTDMLPDFLYYYWWAILLCILLIAGVIYLIIRQRKGAPIIPVKSAPPTPPFEVALRALSDLKERKLWEKGMEKEYFTELTEILRKYLEQQFSINAMEMTSRQIMQTLSGNAEVRDKRQLVRQILDMADFVKFAKVRPLPSDNVAALENAVAFVEETAPKTSEETETPPTAESGKSDKSGKGGER